MPAPLHPSAAVPADLGDLRLVRESATMSCTGTDPARRPTSPRGRIALVGRADVVNKNGRLYPRAAWERVIEHANGVLCPAGRLGGAVDHQAEADGGKLRDTCLRWSRLWIEPDGAVYGEFTVVEGHSRGRDLAALMEAKVAIGFSTYGKTRARNMTPQERLKYGVRAGENAVVMFDWDLIAIDAVNDPSEASAWLIAQERAGSTLRPGDAGFTFAEWFTPPPPARHGELQRVVGALMGR